MKLKEDFLEQLVNSFVVDRLADVYAKDKEYQKRLKDEDLIYQKLLDELTEEQAEELEQYFVATAATAARKETLTYTQGMKDLLALLRTLS